MGRYNLLDEAWIPVLRKDTGKVEEVSLLTLFSQAKEYYALAGEMETQNFAILRVLLAILVTVFTRVDAEGEPYDCLMLDETKGARLILKEPVDEVDADEYMDALDETWETIWKKHRFPEVVCQYLEAWRDRFYLLDETYPFFQVTKQNLESRPKEKQKKATNQETIVMGKQINRLISESGDDKTKKPAIFSPVVGERKNRLSEAEFVRWLITAQGYIGTFDKCIFMLDEKKKNSKGWLYDIGGIYMEGDDLFETLWMNTMLHHVMGEQYTIVPQTPCWEDEPRQRLDEILRGCPQTNLASLYTAWSRAIYIPPTWNSKMDASIGIVKVTEIDHENAFLEPMTLWTFNKTGEHQNRFTPRVHRPEQALWRSFGLLISDENNAEAKCPGIIDYYHKIAPSLENRMVQLHAVSMLSDGGATSWMPVDEVTDTLLMNEILLTDTGKDGWSIRVRDTAEDTKSFIENIYGDFLYDIAYMRNLYKKNKKKDMDKIAFVKNKKAEIYEAIDGPFRDWLCNINPSGSMDEQVHTWKLKFRFIMLTEVKKIMERATVRDYIIKENKNIIIAYQTFKFKLNKYMPSETCR